jgi:hypothetical protein
VKLWGLTHRQAAAADALRNLFQPLPPLCPALVQLLGPDSSADVEEAAADALGLLAFYHVQNQAAIASAGAIPALVQLLGPDSSARTQEEAAGALRNLAEH